MSNVSGNDLAAVEEAHDGSPELQELLTCYARTLETIDKARVIVWFRPLRPRLPHWLQVPALSRIVRAFYLRYVYRSVNALKCDAIRKDALSNDAADPNRDLTCLQQFEQSLPPKARLVVVWPLLLLGLLGVAYLLAFSYGSALRSLLGNLTYDAVTLNRVAAIEAVASAHRIAIIGIPDEKQYLLYDIWFFSREIMVLAWAAFLVMLPFLSAHSYYRQLRAESASAEESIPALSAARGREIELDLLAYTLLLPGVAVYAYVDFFSAWENPKFVIPKKGIACALLIAFSAFEIVSRYLERRYGKSIRRGVVTQTALFLTVVLSLVLSLYSPYHYYFDQKSEDRWPLKVVQSPLKVGDEHTQGYFFNQAFFIVTKLEKNAKCEDEPPGYLIDKPQFLKFEIETWSDVDQFVTPDIATALLLHNWSILNKTGSPTINLFLYSKCGQGTDAVAQPMVAGHHTKTTVVVAASQDAACLQLRAPNYHAVWLWPISPDDVCPEEGSNYEVCCSVGA